MTVAAVEKSAPLPGPDNGADSTTSNVYGARTTKCRSRLTQLQLQELDHDLRALAGIHSDYGNSRVTARQVYYLAVTHGLVAKDTSGYRMVLRRLGELRESGRLPWHWIADNARTRRQYASHENLAVALDDMQAAYRRDYWMSQPYRVECWVESDSIATALDRTVLPYGVPIYTCRGQSSKTFIKLAADESARVGKPIRVIYVGDWDPTGLAIDRSLLERYGRYSGDPDHLTVTRVAVTADQISEFDLPSTPAKTGDPNFARFSQHCHDNDVPVAAVETEALDPGTLRELVSETIECLIDLDAWEAVRIYEEAERDQLRALVASFAGGQDD